MNWEPVDVVVLILAIVLGVGLMTSAFGNVLLGIEVTEERAEIINIAVGGIISIIALYIGARIGK